MKILKSMWNDLNLIFKKLNWKLMVSIFLITIIPTIYKTTRIFFIGTIEDPYSYSIAAQIQWLNIAYEIITEAIIVPLFFVISNIKKNENKLSIDNKKNITLISLIVFIIFLLFTIIIFSTLKPMLNSLLDDQELINKSYDYMRYETWAIFLTSIASFLIIIISTLRMRGFFVLMILMNVLYLFVNIILDLFILSNYSFSLKLGFIGAGISSVVSSFVFFITPLIFMISKKVFVVNIQTSKFFDFKIYFKNFLFAGIETLVRNVIFSYMIIGMMNKIGEQGIYWQANSFIWTWMLLPISIFSLFIKETHFSTSYFDNEEKDRKTKLIFYNFIVFIIVLFWIILIPINPFFMKTIMNYENFNDVNRIVLILFSFYVCYAFSSIIDSIFIATGRIDIFLLQTIIVNFTIYPVYFILYKTNVWTPTIESIAIMFGLGLLLDLIVDVILLIFIDKLNLNSINKLINKK